MESFMPIYEYSCTDCGTQFELIIHSGDKAVCASCGSTQVERKLSLFAVNSSAKATPGCACGDGYQKGRCGSGMCGAR